MLCEDSQPICGLLSRRILSRHLKQLLLTKILPLHFPIPKFIMESSFWEIQSFQADDFSFEGAEIQEMLNESLGENLLPFGDEPLVQKKHSGVPLEHNYAFNVKKDPEWSQSESIANTQNGDEEYQRGLSENDMHSQSMVDNEWVDQFLKKTVKNNESVNCSDPAVPPPSSMCSQKPTTSSVKAGHSDANPPDSTMPSTSKKSRKRKASGYSTESDAGETVLDRNTKNAIAARENRLKKKIYVEGLENKNQELEQENKVMQDKMEEQEDRINHLEREVEYLKNVLHNQSALSSLLGNLDPDTSVRLSIAGQGGKRRRGGASREVISMSKGVCLHVDGQTASLEFCSLCAVKAKGGSI